MFAVLRQGLDTLLCPNISFWGHLGGVVAGILLTLLRSYGVPLRELMSLTVCTLEMALASVVSVIGLQEKLQINMRSCKSSIMNINSSVHIIINKCNDTNDTIVSS